MNKICDVCKGTGLQRGPIVNGRAIQCNRCYGKGFTEVTSLVNGEEEFYQKKRLEGIKDVILLVREDIRSGYAGVETFRGTDKSHVLRNREYSIKWDFLGDLSSTIGTVPYEDFLTDNVNIRTVSLHPNTKKLTCPGFILEHMLQKGREVECLLCSGKLTQCPLECWRRTEPLRTCCWRSVEEALNPPTTPPLVLSEEEYRILRHYVNSYSSSILQTVREKNVSKEVLYACLSLKWKICNTSTEQKLKDISYMMGDFPIENPLIKQEIRDLEDEIDPGWDLKRRLAEKYKRRGNF